MIEATIRLFKGVLKNNKNTDALFALVNQEATKHGLIAPKEICSEELYEYFKNKPVNNRNTTFYKTWNEVTSKNRFTLFIDQITHYLSTYGTNFEDEAYIPNNNPEITPFDSYTVIKSLSKKEIINNCEKLVSANVALDENTIKDILTIFTHLNHTTNYDIVNNKEILMHLHDINNTIPNSPVEMVRFLLFKSTGKTLLIKDKNTINNIKIGKDVSEIIKECGLEKLAIVFYRFKPIFLALKNENNASLINKIRRLANKYHKPMETGYFENILSKKKNIEEVTEKLKTLNNFKKITLLNTILNKLDNKSNFSPYTIRNGKLYVKEHKTLNIDDNYLEILYDTIYDSLISSIGKKACKVILPENINIAMPTSSKKFIGEVPFGSIIKMNNTDNIIGIHWKDKNGAKDIDLSAIDFSGNKIGWNAGYYNANNSVIYSGDMTSANPEATELLYTSGNFKPSIVNVNLYHGEPNSKFEFFIAQEQITDMRKGYMVNPNNIVFKTDCTFENEKEQILGIVTKKEFVFQSMKINARNVSSNSAWKQGYINYMINSIKNTVMLNNVLVDAGFEIVKKQGKNILDLSNFSKAQILNLVS